MKQLFVNGNIVTMDAQQPIVEAMIVDKGIIKWTGNNEEALALLNEDIVMIDLKQKTVIPGLNDSHLHLLNFGFSLSTVNLRGAKSIKDIIKTVKYFIHKHDVVPNHWIVGRGWNQDYFQGECRFPTRYDLDCISLEHPIVLSRACGHVAVLNSKALELCGLQTYIPVIEGGTIEVDALGTPTGLISENALELIFKHIPRASKALIKSYLVAAMKVANAHGITSVQSDDLASIPGYTFQEILNIYQELNFENQLSCRIYEQCLLPRIQDVLAFLEAGYYTGLGDEYFKIGPLKLLTDGSLGARTAAMSNPYHDDLSTSGILCYTEKQLQELVDLAHKNKMQIAIHAIGDRAIKVSLNCIETSLNEMPSVNHRHSLVHCQITDEGLLNQMSSLGVVALVQPIFLDYDLNIVKSRVGAELASTSYAFKTMLNKRVHVAFGTDCPVESLATMPNLHFAVNRKPDAFHQERECLKIEDALHAYTMGSAYASFEEEVKGSISVGKYADFVVLDQDILKVPPAQMKDLKVLQTYVGGRLVYQNNEIDDSM